MKARILLAITTAVMVLPIVCGTAQGQGTAFTYQGRLGQDGAPANGNYDFRFGLYTNVSTGSQVGSLETNANTAVSNGVFTTTLNFSNVFNGTAYWLDIGVRTNGSTNTFTPLTPRQPITPAPYAITASNLTGTLPAAQLTGSLPAGVLTGIYSNSVSFTNTNNIFAGNGSNLTGVPSVTQSNLLYAYDTTSQYVSSAGGFQNVAFGTTTSSGWLVIASGEFVAQQSGVYLVQYQAHFGNANTSFALTGMIRAILNLTSTPSEITSSEAAIYIPASSVGLASRSFLISMTAGQMISLQMTSNQAGTGGAFLESSVFFGQFFPSVSITIVRVQ